MRKWFAALAAALALTVSVGAHADERQRLIEIFETHSKSVGALYAHNTRGDMNFLCSATAVDHYTEAADDSATTKVSTVILTAHHCLERGVSYLINFGDGTLRPLRPWKVPHYEVSDKNKRAYGEPMSDMALFLMAGTDVPLAKMGASTALKNGSKLVMVGYPLGVAKISYEGILAGRLDRFGADNHGYLLMQIFGAPGSSGSAVLDADTGTVVGVLVAVSQAQVGLPVVFGTPIEYKKYLDVVQHDSR